MTSMKVLIAAVCVLWVVCSVQAVPYPFERAVDAEQNCKCMPWRVCNGKINDAVNCHQSYIMICCIIEPERAVDERLKAIPFEIEHEA